MDVLNLFGGFGVEVDKLLASWSTRSLLVVGVETAPEGGCSSSGFGGELVLLIDGFGLISSLSSLVELLKSL